MKFSPASQIAQHAEDRREVLARELYDFEKIHAAIKQAATAGLNSYRIAQTHYADLKHTAEAERLIIKLKASGYECTWMKIALNEKVNGKDSTVMVTYNELIVSWGITMRTMVGMMENA